MKKILIVDDDSDILEVIEVYLSSNPNYEIETCTSGEKAKELLVQNEYDLLITDMIMPDTNGIELTEFTFKNCEKTKVLACSGGGDSGKLVAGLALDQAMTEGAHNAILKPFTEEELITKVKNLIGQ